MKSSFTSLLLLAGAFFGATSQLNAQTYCPSQAGSAFDSDITRVTLGNIDNNTTNGGCATYTHFTNMSTDLYVGSSYEIFVELGVHSGGCGSDIYTKSWRAWIDFNGDGDFDDAGELLGNGNYTGGTFTSSATFQVPCIATAGTKRMRVVCMENTPTAIQPCAAYTYGETEDYNVNIIPGSSPTADFVIPDTVYTDWSAQFINVNQAGYSHKWYNSDLDPTLQTVNSTSVNYTHVFTTPGTYTIRLESSNCQGTAIKNKTFTVVAPTSIPEPNFVVSTNFYAWDGNPIEIHFYDLSLYGPTDWEWTITPDWLNGAPWFWSNGSEFSQNPSAFFYDPGTYEVCLTVTNSLGTSAPLCRTAYIVIGTPSGSSVVNILGENPNSNVDSGWIYDTGGPNGPYDINEYEEFTIQPCGATSVTLNFTSFDLQTGDQLTIHNGDNSGPVIGNFTGNTLPSSVTASSGMMTLVMQTNASGNGSGFAATWTSTIPQNGPVDADFVVPDTLWECSGGTDVTLWNSTTGVVPGQATYEWIIDYDPNVTYPYGYADATDENLEVTVPYTGSYEEYQFRLVAITCEGNDTTVRTLRVSPGSMLPSVDFTASNRRVATNSVVKFMSTVEAGCSYNWNITPAGWSFENGTDADDQNIEVKFTSPGSYHVELEVTNDNGTTTELKTNYVDVIEYCTPGVGNSSINDVGINLVQIENINNTTASGQVPGYTNYSNNMVVTLTSGEEYSLTVGRNTTFNPATRKAWIDFNRDGVFDDNTERVLFEANASTSSYTATFTVPDYKVLVEGPSRLRVSTSMGNGSNMPCGPLAVGEFEDYGVQLRLDDQPPVITLNGADTIWLEVNSTYTELFAQAMDNIQGDISGDIVITNQIDLTQPGYYFVHYDVTDASGLKAVRKSRTIIVSTDLTKPVLTLTGGSPYVHPVLIPWTEPGYDGIDFPSGANVTDDVIVSGTVDVNTIGDYVLHYKLSDVNGNATEEFRTVQVRDIDAPTVGTPAQVFWQVGVPFVNPFDMDVADNFDQNPVIDVDGEVFHNIFGVYTVVVTASDFSGNQSAPKTIQVTVGDTIKPVITTLLGSEILVVEVNNAGFFEPPVSATDNYFPNVSLVRDASALKIYELGVYPIVYTATDGAGNSSTYTRMIYVVDTEKPTVIAPPLNLVRWSGPYDPMQGVSAIDNYWSPSWFASNDAIEVVLDNVDINYPGVYNIVYRATDGSGNVSPLTMRIVYVSTPTALEGVELENMVQVYPNPSTGRFTLKLDAAVQTQNAQVQVVDMLGNVVFKADSEVFVNGEAALDLTGVSNGVYIIQLSTEQGVISKRITINN